MSVDGVIEPALQAAEMRRSAARPTTDLTAYDLYLRALAVVFPITKEGVLEALGLFEQAIAMDRHYGPALSWAAMCHVHLVINGWAEAPETNGHKAAELARQALAAALAHFGEDIGAMMALVDRALALNPSFARGWLLSGLLRVFAGQHDLAIEHLETALRLSPRERMGQPLSAMGTGYFFKRRFDEAAAKLLLAIQDHPGFSLSYRSEGTRHPVRGVRAAAAALAAVYPVTVVTEFPRSEIVA